MRVALKQFNLLNKVFNVGGQPLLARGGEQRPSLC
jgi:hypothetical protein